METSRVLHLVCGHRIGRKDHRWIGGDGLTIYDTQKCLDIAEGRKPHTLRDDDK